MKSMPRIRNGFRGERIIVIPSFIIEELKTDTLGRELYITDIGYFPRAFFHYCERSKEEAKDFVLIYCAEGEGWVNLNEKKYTISRNQFFILPKNKTYSYGSDINNPWTIYWIHFNGEKAAFFSSGLDRPVDLSSNSYSRIEDRLSMFEEIYASLSYGYKKNNLLYATTSFFHFLGTIKFLGEYKQCSRNEDKNKDLVDIAIHYMRENINRKLSLSEIARYVNLSESYFSGVFVKKTGYSPLRYLANLRIEQACHYLDFTDMKVNQICPLIGYDDSLYFSRAFTKYMGMSPSVYRAHKRSGVINS